MNVIYVEKMAKFRSTLFTPLCHQTNKENNTQID